ncbi:alpha-1B adrenergic receptor-like [Alosa pseudoharengus]|uniref:alpha-1B adrenergic receptor-like n=1 Tax=Alosa pseudoharengus TaxID=34774 RepID=UPI003F89BCCF
MRDFNFVPGTTNFRPRFCLISQPYVYVKCLNYGVYVKGNVVRNETAIGCQLVFEQTSWNTDCYGVFVKMRNVSEDATNFWQNDSYELYNGTHSLENYTNTTSPNRTSQTALVLWRAIPLGLVLGTFIFLAIVGNILVILSVICNRHLRIPTNYFIINLAIADLLLGTTVLPVSATLEILDYWVFGRIFCDIWAALDVLCCTASIMSLCVISIDRYIGVSYPLQYPNIVTERRALLAMVGVWILSLVISIGPLLGWKQPPSPEPTICLITEEPFYALFSSLGSFYIPLIVILVMYFRVYVVVKRTTKNLEAGVMRERLNSSELTLRIHRGSQMQDGSGGARSQGHQARNSLTVKVLKFSREKKAAKTLGVVVGMFTLCWLPFFLSLPIVSFNNSLRPPELVSKVIFWLGYFNSCMNPIIYPCYSRAFKLAFIRILRCQCHEGRRPGWRGRVHNYASSQVYAGGSTHRGSAGSLQPNGSKRMLSLGHRGSSPGPGLAPCPEDGSYQTLEAISTSTSGNTSDYQLGMMGVELQSAQASLQS